MSSNKFSSKTFDFTLQVEFAVILDAVEEWRQEGIGSRVNNPFIGIVHDFGRGCVGNVTSNMRLVLVLYFPRTICLSRIPTSISAIVVLSAEAFRAVVQLRISPLLFEANFDLMARLLAIVTSIIVRVVEV